MRLRSRAWDNCATPLYLAKSGGVVLYLALAGLMVVAGSWLGELRRLTHQQPARAEDAYTISDIATSRPLLRVGETIESGPNTTRYVVLAIGEHLRKRGIGTCYGNGLQR